MYVFPFQNMSKAKSERMSKTKFVCYIEYVIPTFTCEKEIQINFYFLVVLNGSTHFRISFFQFPFFRNFPYFFIRMILLMGAITPDHFKTVSTLNTMFIYMQSIEQYWISKFPFFTWSVKKIVHWQHTIISLCFLFYWFLTKLHSCCFDK